MALFNKKGKSAGKKKSKGLFAKKKREGSLLSIDIGSKKIKAVVGSYVNGKFNISSMHSIDQNENVYDAGIINDIASVSDKIKKLIKDNNIKEKDTVISIESSEIIKRQISIPVIDDKDILNVITYEIGEYLPIDAEKYIIQYTEIDRFVEDGVDKMSLLVYAFPQEAAESYFEMVKSCDLNPVTMDVHSNCIEKLFNNCMINDNTVKNETTAIIDIGNTALNLTILKNGKYEFNRLIKGNYSIKDALEMSGSCSKENSQQMIEKFEVDNIFDENLEKEFVPVQDDIIYLADLWVADILKLFQYYTSRDTQNKIDSIYIYGGGANIKNIEFYIANRTGIQTRAIKTISNLQVPYGSKQQELIKYVNAVSALMDMDLNFFHGFIHEKKSKDSSNLKASLPIVLAFVVVVIIIGLTCYNMFTMSFLKKSIANYDITLNEPARIANLKEVDEKQREVNNIKAEKQFLASVDSGLRGIDSVTQQLLELISSKVTDNLYFTNMNVHDKSIDVNGNALSRIEIAQFEYNLRASNLFDGIYVSSINKQEMENQPPYYTFNMRFIAKESLYDTGEQIEDENTPADKEQEPLDGKKDSEKEAK